MIGQTISHYKITAKLGEGGMGEVYLATDTKLDRQVALKFLAPALVGTSVDRERFLREARAAAALDHPNICPVYEIGEEDDQLFIVMGFLSGITLKDKIVSGPLPVSEAVGVADQIASGLAEAHAHGIIHRDIKPENIMVTPKGQVRIMDFGLAKTMGGSTLTQTGSMIGTIAYMSPEQVQGCPLDPRADLWSLGVVLYEMITGRRPFEGEHHAALIYAILNENPPSLSFRRPGVSARLERLVGRVLSRSAGQRHRDAQEFLAELRSVSQVGSLGPVGTPVVTAEELERSIVVLPFANLSPDPDNEYFSDGLTEEVIADLSKVRSLRVISRTTSMRLKVAGKGLRTIAADLNVRYALEGSVRKSGSNLRITAQLIDTQTDSHLWSEKYGGTLDDIFGIQERVSRAIVEALQIRLTADEDRRLAKRPASTGFAYDVYLRARQDIYSFSKERLDRACADLRHAISIVGDDPLLYRGMAMVLWQYINAVLSSDPKYLDDAEGYARKLQRLDPEGPHAAAVLGHIAGARGDTRGWVRGLKRALAADPHDPDYLFWLGFAWLWSGYPQHAKPLLERLQTIDPLFDFLYAGLGRLEYFEGGFASAIEIYRRGWNLTPDRVYWPMLTAQALASLGDVAGAADVIEKSCSDPSAHTLACLSHILLHALRGERDAVERLATSDFESKVWGDAAYTYSMAQSFALLGDIDQGLRWLQRSTERGSIHYPFISARDPLLENLRSDPRFHTLMERVRHEWETFEESVR